jgi:hypothetical protein
MRQATLKSVVERLTAHAARLQSLSTDDRKTLIQLALLDVADPDADPDDSELLDEIEAALARSYPRRALLPRVKALTGMSDGALAELIGKSRPTVQTYMSGKHREILDDNARHNLARVVEDRVAEVNHLLAELLEGSDSPQKKQANNR